MKSKILSFLLYIQPIYLFCFQPIHFIPGNRSTATLINSVSFNSRKNLFCITFTHQHQVGLYQITDNDNIVKIQTFENPDAQLDHPQNAVFSPDGNHLLIVSWSTRNINIYSSDPDGHFQTHPQCVIPFHLSEARYRPHGMCFSPDGNFLALAYGSFEDSPWTVVLYRVYDLGTDHAKLLPWSSLTNGKNLKGVPKGITFSPDGSSLVITFTKTNSLGIFSFDVNGQINPIPAQEISGVATKLYRPEDIAFSHDGTYCAVSNSSGNYVSFYQFDKLNNCFVSDIPFKILNKNDVDFCFPHGLAFSHDGKYFAVTQFGLVDINSEGYLTSWGTPRVEGVFLFKVEN